MYKLQSLIPVVLLSAAGAVHAAPVDLGVAGQFNAFVFDNFETTGHTDAKGSIAAGGNATINYSWSVASDAATFTSGGQSYGMVVGGNLSWNTSGQVFNGKTYVGGTASIGAPQVNINPGGTGGLVGGASPVDFAAAETYLDTLSDTIKAFGNTGSVSYNWGGIQLAGSGAATEVFFINGAQIASNTWLSVSGIAADADVIVNVSGSNITLKNLDLSSPFKASHTLFNFYDAVTLHFESTSPHFSILATDAEITGQWGHIEGTVVASSWKAQTELHYVSSSSGGSSSSGSSSSSGGQVPAPHSLALVVTALGLAFARRQRAR